MDLLFPVFGMLCIAAVCFGLHLVVKDYEDTMREIRKKKGDDDVLFKWLGDSKLHGRSPPAPKPNGKPMPPKK